MVVTLFADPDFAGASLELDVGGHRLFTTADLNDAVSSIRVPSGFVAYVYEHADETGGFGRSVDLIEDWADLGTIGLGDTVSYVDVFPSERDVVSRNHGTGGTDTSRVVWARGSLSNGQFVPGHWERPRAAGQPPPGPPVVSPGPLPHLLRVTRLDSSPWVNPAFDTSAADWSSTLVGGATFDGSSSHSMEWVSVLDPTVEQDDQVGVSGFAVIPEVSGADLPFTHPFGSDFECAVVPDQEHTGLLAASNRDPAGPYASGWTDARRIGLPGPAGMLAMEVDAALVPPAYRVETGDRVGLYGRWIVDAGHDDFHTEIHPPLLMARARAVNDQGTPAYPNTAATTEVRLWSRPYQAAQHFTDGGSTGLALTDYLSNIATTLSDIVAYPPVFARSFDGIHLVAFTIKPPVPNPPPVNRVFGGSHLECSYSLTVNHSCGVQIQQSTSDPNALIVILALNDVGLPTLPELPSTKDKYSIDALLAQMPGSLDTLTSFLVGLVKAWQSRFGTQEADIYVRRYAGPAEPAPAQVVPFTRLSDLPRSSVTVDDTQPFPVIGWIKLKWVRDGLVVGNIGGVTQVEVGTAPAQPTGPATEPPTGPVRGPGRLRLPDLPTRLGARQP